VSRGPLALLAAALVAATAAAAGAPAAGTAECAGLATCIDVPGPWVAVPPHGETWFLLECPGRRGIVGGLDALASSRDIHATWDAQLAAPIAPGRSSSSVALFRAVSGRHRAGLVEPRIGCIPEPQSSAQTTAYRSTPVGPPLDLVALDLPVRPGTVHRGSLGCAHGETLVDSWDAVAFATAAAPDPALAGAIRVDRAERGGRVTVRITVSEGLPRSAGGLVQIGVRCTE
jgi:hypothetical protein